MAFGEQVRFLRGQRKLTQEEVAHRADIHVTYLSGVERGVRNPSLKNIRAIAGALDVLVSDLFAFERALGLHDPRATDFPMTTSYGTG